MAEATSPPFPTRLLSGKVKFGLFAVYLVIGLGALIPFEMLYWSRLVQADIGQSDRRALQLVNLLSLIQDVETGQRGFIITGRDEFLEPYRQGLDGLEQARPALRREMAAEGEARAQLDALDRLLDAKLSELSRTIALRRVAGFGAVEPIVTGAAGKVYMDEIRHILATLQAQQQHRKNALVGEMQRRQRISAYVGVGAAFLSMGLLAALFLQFFRLIVARRSAEQQAQRNFHFLAESVPQMVWTATPDGAADYYNQRWYTFTGMTQQQALDGEWGPVHPDDLPNSLRAWHQSVQSGDPYEVEHRFRRASDGAYRWHLCRALTLRDAHGVVTKWFGTCTDVHDYKETDAKNRALQRELERRVRRRTAELEEANGKLQVFARKLELSARRLELAVGAAAMGVWEWEFASQTLQWDYQMHRLYARAPADAAIPFSSWMEWVHAEDRRRVESALSLAVTSGADFVSEFRIRWPSGEIRHLKAAAQWVNDPNGQPARLVGVNWDVTERALVEGALTQTSSLLRTVLDSATDLSIIATAPDLTITVFNRGAEQMLGYAGVELVDKMTPLMLHEVGEVAERAAELSLALGRSVEGAGVFTEPSVLHVARDWTHVRKDGGRVPVSLIYSAMFADNGELTGYLGIARDISHARAQERTLQQAIVRAEQASAAKSQFLANMSHEIRTPLNAVIGLSYLLEQTTLNQEQRSFLTQIQFAGRSLLSAVNDVLDLSRIEAGEMVLDEVRFDLLALTRQIAQLSAAQAETKGIALDVQHATDVPRWVVGDATRWGQVMSNLLNNAVKFTEAGQVAVSLSCLERSAANTTIRCSVRDTGLGIAAEHLTRIFEPFAQADVSTTRRFGGTGLGLSIARRLVTLMDGRIGVTSDLGVGSEFWFEVPLRNETDSAFEPADPNSRPLRTLILGAGAACSSLESMIRRFGWLCEAAASIEEALIRLRSERPGSWPDVIFIDAALPSLAPLEPLELLGSLTQACPTRELPPVIVIDDEQTSYYAQGRVPLGVNAIVARPLNSSNVFNAVNSVITRRDGEQRGTLECSDSGLAHVQWLVGAHVLLVDDSEVNRVVAQRILISQGARVTTCTDGLEAVERLREAHEVFDIVLMDVQMPRLDGNAATERIRTELKLKALPIIALTAGALVSERERCFEAGMNEFLSKPLDPTTLIRVVRRLVGEHRGAPLPVGMRAAEVQPVEAGADLNSIDAEVVRRVFGNDTRLFASLLERMLRDSGDCALPVAVGSLDGIERSKLLTRMHKLRGSAGVLGATRVQRSAASVECALIESQPALRIEDHLRELAAALTELAEEARPLLEARSVPDALTVNDSAPALQESAAMIRHLLNLVDDQDLGAIDEFAAVAPSLTVALGAARREALKSALEELNFPDAAELLRSVGESTGSGPA